MVPEIKLQKVLCGIKSSIPVLLPYHDLHGTTLIKEEPTVNATAIRINITNIFIFIII